MGRYAEVALVSILIAIALMPSIELNAESLTIYATIDCYITSWAQGSNFHGEVLRVSRLRVEDKYDEARSIIYFDLSVLSGVPKGSKVEEASLILKLVNHSGVKVEVWELAKEPDIYYVSWLRANPSEYWLTPGGDLLRKIGEATTSSNELRIDMKDYLQSLVNSELNSPGWFLLKLADGEEGYLNFYSELSGSKPRIELSFKPASLELSLDSADVKLSQGSSTVIKVYVNGYLGSPVSLEVSGPAFLNYTLSPIRGYPSFISMLNITVPETAPGGSYAVTISAIGPIKRNATLRLTILERKGFAVIGPSSVGLRGGFLEVLQLKVLPTGNYSGSVSATILESPDWLNITLNPPEGRPPFNVSLELCSLPEANASGRIRILLRGVMSKYYEIYVRTRPRRVAIYSNEIDWSLSRELIRSYSNSSGVVVRRINDSSSFSDFDLVIILGGHKAPVDRFMPVNVADRSLNETEKKFLEEGGDLVSVKRKGSTFIVIVAGKTRKETMNILSSDRDGNGLPLFAELVLRDPREVERSYRS